MVALVTQALIFSQPGGQNRFSLSDAYNYATVFISGSLKYDHLDIPARHGLLARCLLQKTHPEMRPFAIPFTGCPKLVIITPGYEVLGVV